MPSPQPPAQIISELSNLIKEQEIHTTYVLGDSEEYFKGCIRRIKEILEQPALFNDKKTEYDEIKKLLLSDLKGWINENRKWTFMERFRYIDRDIQKLFD